jgi:hypothetical protein
MYKFFNNGFKLFHPQNDKKTGLPKFLCEQSCPWGGKTFEALSPQLKDKFLDTHLQVAQIQSDNVNEIRELFVRLQAGLPLNAQEKRDAWPGDFSQFVIRTAGKKPSVIGHDFFSKMVRSTGEKRGGSRQACAQIFMSYYSRRHHGPFAFCNLNSQQIDEFYRHHLDFHPDSPGSMVWRFNRILDTAYDMLGDGKRPPLRLHSALHTVLLIDSLIDRFTPEWQNKFPEALDEFLLQLSQATKEQSETNEYWSKYGVFARTGSMNKDSIQKRHDFFLKKMLDSMKPLIRRDPQRAFTREERELLYFSSSKKCSICGGTVNWLDAEVHHSVPHSEGGITMLDNAELVHRDCHPRGRAPSIEAKAEVKDEEMISTDIPWEIDDEGTQ